MAIYYIKKTFRFLIRCKDFDWIHIPLRSVNAYYIKGSRWRTVCRFRTLKFNGGLYAELCSLMADLMRNSAVKWQTFCRILQFNGGLYAELRSSMADFIRNSDVRHRNMRKSECSLRNSTCTHRLVHLDECNVVIEGRLLKVGLDVHVTYQPK